MTLYQTSKSSFGQELFWNKFVTKIIFFSRSILLLGWGWGHWSLIKGLCKYRSDLNMATCVTFIILKYPIFKFQAFDDISAKVTRERNDATCHTMWPHKNAESQQRLGFLRISLLVWLVGWLVVFSNGTDFVNNLGWNGKRISKNLSTKHAIS